MHPPSILSGEICCSPWRVPFLFDGNLLGNVRLIPIATGMFAAGTNLEMMIISVSAVLAGAVCGDHISPISDTTVMSSAGAQSNHLNHVSTQMQYAAVTACVCLVGYLIAAVTRTWWIRES